MAQGQRHIQRKDTDLAALNFMKGLILDCPVEVCLEKV